MKEQFINRLIENVHIVEISAYSKKDTNFFKSCLRSQRAKTIPRPIRCKFGS